MNLVLPTDSTDISAQSDGEIARLRRCPNVSAAHVHAYESRLRASADWWCNFAFVGCRIVAAFVRRIGAYLLDAARSVASVPL